MSAIHSTSSFPLRSAAATGRTKRSRRRSPIIPRPDPAHTVAWARVFHARRLLAQGQQMASMHSSLRRLARHEHPAIAEAARRTLAKHGLSLGFEVRA